MAGHRIDDLVLFAAQDIDVDFRLAELDAELGGVVCPVNDVRGVQEGLGRNATHMQARAAGLGKGIDEDRFNIAISGEKRGGITAGAAAKDEKIRLDRGHAHYSNKKLCPIALRMQQHHHWVLQEFRKATDKTSRI